MALSKTVGAMDGAIEHHGRALACFGEGHPPPPPRINQGAANGALDKPYSANIAVSFSRADPASFGLSSAKRIVASTSPRCVPQSKRVPSKR